MNEHENKDPAAPIVAIDFDGVIVDECWPEIGPLVPGAVWAVQAIDRAGNWIVINTCRSGRLADEAKAFLVRNDIPFDAFNENLDHRSQRFGGDCRKISADVYIDDRNLGGFPGWQATLIQLIENRSVMTP